MNQLENKMKTLDTTVSENKVQLNAYQKMIEQLESQMTTEGT